MERRKERREGRREGEDGRGLQRYTSAVKVRPIKPDRNALPFPYPWWWCDSRMPWPIVTIPEVERWSCVDLESMAPVCVYLSRFKSTLLQVHFMPGYRGTQSLYPRRYPELRWLPGFPLLPRCVSEHLPHPLENFQDKWYFRETPGPIILPFYLIFFIEINVLK